MLRPRYLCFSLIFAQLKFKFWLVSILHSLSHDDHPEEEGRDLYRIHLIQRHVHRTRSPGKILQSGGTEKKAPKHPRQAQNLNNCTPVPTVTHSGDKASPGKTGKRAKSANIRTPLYSHLGNESVRKIDFYGLAIALTKS